MSRDLERRRHIELWISWVRLIAVPVAVIEVGFLSSGYPPGYERWAWIVSSALAVGAGVIWLITRRSSRREAAVCWRTPPWRFDVATVGAFVIHLLRLGAEHADPAGAPPAGRRGRRSLRHRRRPRRPASSRTLPGIRGDAPR
jgi:hypothetical protein